MSPVYIFTCGHAGRTAEQHTGFIRVAEIRKASVLSADRPCPDCK